MKKSRTRKRNRLPSPPSTIPLLPSSCRPSLPIPSLLQIVVECQSEQQQRDLFERLRQEGYPCRVLTL